MASAVNMELKELNRRTFLRAGTLCTLGATLPQLLAAREAAAANDSSASAKAKACILLYMTGGPAQQETFDMKPEANDGYGGEFKPIPSNVPGLDVCEYLPLLARNAHRYAVIRSVHHRDGNHSLGTHLGKSKGSGLIDLCIGTW